MKLAQNLVCLTLKNLVIELTDFIAMISIYFAEIWDFLIFLGQISGIMIVLIGAILWFTDVNPKRGKGLVGSGIILSVVIEYFVLFPPGFVGS